MRALIPLFKLEMVRGILEENSLRLASPSVLAQYIPSILEQEKKAMMKDVAGKQISVTFDRTCRVAEVYCYVIRFIDDSMRICMRLGSLKFLLKPLNGEECAGLFFQSMYRDLKIEQ